MDFEAAGIGGSDGGPGRAEGMGDGEIRRGTAGAVVDDRRTGDTIVLEPRESMVSELHGWLAFLPGWQAPRA